MITLINRQTDIHDPHLSQVDIHDPHLSQVDIRN